MNTTKYENSHKLTLSVIERLISNLEKYKQRTDANQQYIETQTQMINILLDYTIISSSLLSRAFEIMQTEYNRGFKAGIEKQQKKQINQNNKIQGLYEDKETTRFNSIVNAMTMQPNLF